jgi:endonuclease/exonuclease/phosphatase (EEP) superfamily protein YafD
MQSGTSREPQPSASASGKPDPVSRAAPAQRPVPAPAPYRRRPFVPILCLLYAGGVLAFWITIRYLGDHWWPATILLYAPRWPWLLPLFVLLPLTLRRRAKKWMWLTFVAGIFVLGPLMGLSVPWRRFAQDTQGLKLRLLVCNVHAAELNLPALDAYVREVDPQVVMLQDYVRWHDLMPAVAGPGWHHYQLGEIFIASRFPLVRVYDLNLERIPGKDDADPLRRAGSAVCFDLDSSAGILHLFDLHLASPHPALRTLRENLPTAVWRLEADSTRRWNESQQITDYLATLHGPFVLAGDFNTPAESPIFRHFWWKYPDAFPTAGFGFGYTHLSWLSEIRIDHLLCGPGVSCTAYHTGPPCGTPHRPMVADLVIRKME